MTEQTLTQDEVIHLFSCGGGQLAETLQGLSESDLDLSEAEGEWTIRQIVHHLVDDGDVWAMCFKKAIATPGAHVRFEGFPGNEVWANGLDFHKRTITHALALIEAHRRTLTELLEYFSPAWDRCISIVGANGEVAAQVSVGQMAKMLADHFSEHIDTINRIKHKHSR